VSTERVDKRWAEKGLAPYSTEAILGTLAHYGVTTDEQAFKALAASKYPMTLAVEWAPRWRGTGQFKEFLPAAVHALWARWLPGVITPERVGAPLLGLLRALGEDAAVAERIFPELEPLLPQLPQDGRRAEFMRELEPWLDLGRVSIEGLIDELAQKPERLGQAQRLAAVSDALFPERKDVVAAVLQGRTGDAPAAKAALTAIARDAGRPDMVRLAAVDALVPLEGGAEVFDVVAQLQEKAVREGSTAVLYALHATTHLLGPHLSGPARQQAQGLVAQQHDELHRLTGRHAH
jgi:hypothetical protein